MNFEEKWKIKVFYRSCDGLSLSWQKLVTPWTRDVNWNLHKIFRGTPGHLLKVPCMINLHTVSRGSTISLITQKSNTCATSTMKAPINLANFFQYQRQRLTSIGVIIFNVGPLLLSQETFETKTTFSDVTLKDYILEKFIVNEMELK